MRSMMRCLPYVPQDTSLAKRHHARSAHHLLDRANIIEKSTPKRAFFWLRNRDSNPNKQSQSLPCCRYTIPHCYFAMPIPISRRLFYHRGAKLSRVFLYFLCFRFSELFLLPAFEFFVFSKPFDSAAAFFGAFFFFRAYAKLVKNEFARHFCR